MKDILAQALAQAGQPPLPDFVLERYIENESYYGIIFKHDFARKFFGEEQMFLVPRQSGGYQLDSFWDEWITQKEFDNDDLLDVRDVKEEQPAWRYHLSQMVQQEHPLEYLKEYLHA